MVEFAGLYLKESKTSVNYQGQNRFTRACAATNTINQYSLRNSCRGRFFFFIFFANKTCREDVVWTPEKQQRRRFIYYTREV